MLAAAWSVRLVHILVVVSCVVIRYLCNSLLTAPVVGDVRGWRPQIHLQGSGWRHCR